jgi:hydroxypyruvate isomerase
MSDSERVADIKGSILVDSHFLDRTPAGLEIIDRVDHPSMLLLRDMCHSEMMGERPEDASRYQYAGPVGLEYWPTGSTEASLATTRRALGGT